MKNFLQGLNLNGHVKKLFLHKKYAKQGIMTTYRIELTHVALSFGL